MLDGKGVFITNAIIQEVISAQTEIFFECYFVNRVFLPVKIQKCMEEKTLYSIYTFIFKKIFVFHILSLSIV